MQVEVFGHLRASSGDLDVELGGSKQRLVLLALLLANGSVVSTDDLIDLIWGDTPPSKPNVTLRSYVSHLRRVLEPSRGPGERAQVLLTRSPGYAVDPDQLDVDVHHFTAAANDAVARAADRAPSETTLATATAFDHWPDQGAMPIDAALRPLADFPDEVSRLTELHLVLSIVHYRAALATGRALEILSGLESASNQHPSSEELVALRMTALYQAGRQTDALAVFQAARSRLLEDFGLEPTPILTDLEQRILESDPVLMEVQPTRVSRGSDPSVRPPPPFGRAETIDRLTEALPGPKRSEPGGAIIGPPGIGKSTVLHALADLATHRSMTTVWGRCADTGSAATLRPWKSVLRDLLERTDPGLVNDIFAPQGNELVSVVPELGELLDLDIDRPTPGADVGDAITRTLCRWAANRPLVICLEDLHWADPESLVVAKHLLGSITHTSDGPPTVDPPLSLLMTWRDTDVAVEAVDGRQPRTRHLADLGRAVGGCRLLLGGLDPAGVTEVVRSIAQVDPDPADVQRLTDHTGGNPLFVTELLREGRGQSFEPTDTIRDVVLRRLDILPDTAIEIMTAAALCHPSIDEQILPELTGRTTAELADCLEHALAARLIEESPSQIGHYRFSHDLMAETLAAEIRQRTRSELHAKIGDLLEKQSAPVADIAHHYLLGVDAGTSLGAARFSLAAALEAEALGDFAGAVTWIDDALAALDRGPDAPALRIDMLIDRAQVLKFLSRHVESQETSYRAFQMAADLGEVDLAVVAALVYVGMPRIDQSRRNAEWLGYWSPPDESVAILQTCLELMPADHQWRSAATLALSNQMFAAHHDQEHADELARVGLARLRDDHQPISLAEGLVSMAVAHCRTFPLDEREAMLTEAVATARAIDYPKVELRARKALIGVALDRRDLPAANAQVEAAELVAARTDDPFVAMQATSMQVSLDLLAGDHERARDRIVAAFTEHHQLGEAAMDTLGMQYFTLARHHGNFDAIIAGIRDKLTGYDGPAYGAPLAAMQARSGDLDGALATIGRFSEDEITWGGEGILQFMTPSYFAEAIADLSIERPSVLHLAHPLLDALEPATQRMVCLVGGADYPSTGSYYRGRLLTSLHEVDAAAEMLEHSIDHLSSIGAAPALFWTQLAIAENRSVQGDADAPAAVEALRPEAERMNMAWAIDWQQQRIQQRFNATN